MGEVARVLRADILPTIVSLQQLLIGHAGHDVALQEHLPLHVQDAAHGAVHVRQVIIQVSGRHRVGGACPSSAVAAAVVPDGVVHLRRPGLLWLWSPQKSLLVTSWT